MNGVVVFQQFPDNRFLVPPRNRDGISGQSSPKTSEMVIVGKISKPMGIRGWVYVRTFSDYPERFAPGSKLGINLENGFRRLTIEESQTTNRNETLKVRFKECRDRNTAETLRGKFLYISLAERFPPPPESYYPDELVGMNVLSPEGAVEGEVLRLEAEVPSPFLVVNSKRFGEIMIPFRKIFCSIERNTKEVKLTTPIEQHVPDIP